MEYIKGSQYIDAYHDCMCIYIYIHTHNMYMIVYVYPMHSPVVSIIIDKPSVETNECPDATGTENP